MLPSEDLVMLTGAPLCGKEGVLLVITWHSGLHNSGHYHSSHRLSARLVDDRQSTMVFKSVNLVSFTGIATHNIIFPTTPEFCVIFYFRTEREIKEGKKQNK